MPIKYHSTNKESKDVGFKTALLKGQAPDSGLYMPNEVPTVSKEEFEEMKNMNYPEVAAIVVKKFLKEIPKEKIQKMCKEAYKDLKVPLEKVDEKNYILRMGQGPTASFKDYAALLMSRLMGYYSKNMEEDIIVLVATSGDTGSAIANGFYDVDGVKVVVMYPKNEVTKRQARLMDSLGKNIHALAVDGVFDDLQSNAICAFDDKDLNNKLKEKGKILTSANSINWGRIMPQIIYYFYAASRIKNNENDIIFSVPSGNFGNVTAGLFSKKMKNPVSRFIIPTNENDEFPVFMQTGIYKATSPSKNCISNAMNVGDPSNLRRLFELYDGQLIKDKGIKKMPNLENMKKDIFSVSVTDNLTLKTMKSALESDLILEPHGAVGWAGSKKYRMHTKDKDSIVITLETAHPAKFPKNLEKIGANVKLPKSMKDVDEKKSLAKNVSKDYSILKDFLLDL